MNGLDVKGKETERYNMKWLVTQCPIKDSQAAEAAHSNITVEHSETN